MNRSDHHQHCVRSVIGRENHPSGGHYCKRIYNHESVNHSEKEYVRGDAHTNTIESYWSLLKRGINGTYIHVSKKHLQKYLWEFEYRHNLRRSPHLMVDLLLLLVFQKPALP